MKFTISFIVETTLNKKDAYSSIVKPAVESMMDILRVRFECPISPFSVEVSTQGDKENGDS